MNVPMFLVHTRQTLPFASSDGGSKVSLNDSSSTCADSVDHSKHQNPVVPSYDNSSAKM